VNNVIDFGLKPRIFVEHYDLWIIGVSTKSGEDQFEMM